MTFDDFVRTELGALTRFAGTPDQVMELPSMCATGPSVLSLCLGAGSGRAARFPVQQGS